jgi:hypothetical protein
MVIPRVEKDINKRLEALLLLLLLLLLPPSRYRVVVPSCWRRVVSSWQRRVLWWWSVVVHVVSSVKSMDVSSEKRKKKRSNVPELETPRLEPLLLLLENRLEPCPPTLLCPLRVLLVYIILVVVYS